MIRMKAHPIVLILIAGLCMSRLANAEITSCGGPKHYIYAQKLVDDTVARHPDLIAMVMHVQPPDCKDNYIIASNIWLTGEISDPDDLHVITSGTTNTEINKAGTKFEVELVMKNVFGENIGSVATVFPYKRGDSKAIFVRKAELIRNELQRRILDPENLMDSYPYKFQTPYMTYAQTLVLSELRSHPNLFVLRIVAVPPNGKRPIVLASNIGRAGDDPSKSDQVVAATSTMQSAPSPQSGRFFVAMPLKESAGRSIGVLSAEIRGTSIDSANNELRSIGQSVAARISSLPDLFEAVH